MQHCAVDTSPVLAAMKQSGQDVKETESTGRNVFLCWCVGHDKTYGYLHLPYIMHVDLTVEPPSPTRHHIQVYSTLPRHILHTLGSYFQQHAACIHLSSSSCAGRCTQPTTCPSRCTRTRRCSLQQWFWSHRSSRECTRRCRSSSATFAAVRVCGYNT